MSTDIFSTKLDELPSTVARVARAIPTAMPGSIRSGQDAIVFSIGSGGSAVAADFLARCRATLGFPPTLVMTPEAFCFQSADIKASDVWIFSAGGKNADAFAAFEAAKQFQARTIHVVTSAENSPLGDAAETASNSVLHIVDVEGRKDGFLATHTLIGCLTALLLSANRVSGKFPVQDVERSSIEAASLRLSREARHAIQEALSAFARSDCLLLLADPRLDAAATAIETSLWEAAICPVQRTDFRNFAHGRHVWPARRTRSSFLVGLTGTETRGSWRSISDNLQPLRTFEIDYKDCGRFQSFLAVLDAFVVVEALGQACGVDPGKPGVGPNAAAIYEGRTLLDMVQARSPSVRHKMKAHYRRDDPSAHEYDWPSLSTGFRQKLGEAEIGAVILDYDGTIVPADDPYQAPSPSTIAQLLRLMDEGIEVAIATGRGGSLGENLRPALPPSRWDQVLVGYYNGGLLRPLSVDIAEDPPPLHPAIADLDARLRQRPDLFLRYEPKNSKVQLSFKVSDIVDPEEFSAEFVRSRFGGSIELSMWESGRMIDIVLADACKSHVIAAIRERLGGTGEKGILCIGDSGDRSGNDHAFLGHALGVSVGNVCDRGEVCWSLFGEAVVGPAALNRVLSALRATGKRTVRLDLSDLPLEALPD